MAVMSSKNFKVIGFQRKWVWIKAIHTTDLPAVQLEAATGGELRFLRSTPVMLIMNIKEDFIGLKLSKKK